LKRIRFRRKQTFQKPPQEIYPVNEKIRVPEVRVIDENGQMLGVLPTQKAILLAKEKGLDLVAVSPKAVPPVAKFINYGSFKYQQEKALKKQKSLQKKTDTKSIRLSPRIGNHDFNVRINQAEKFLNKGDKISAEIFLKGRERQHPELAKELMEKFVKTLEEKIKIKLEQEIKRQGNKFTIIIAPKPDVAEETDKKPEQN